MVDSTAAHWQHPTPRRCLADTRFIGLLLRKTGLVDGLAHHNKNTKNSQLCVNAVGGYTAKKHTSELIAVPEFPCDVLARSTLRTLVLHRPTVAGHEWLPAHPTLPNPLCGTRICKNQKQWLQRLDENLQSVASAHVCYRGGPLTAHNASHVSTSE